VQNIFREALQTIQNLLKMNTTAYRHWNGNIQSEFVSKVLRLHDKVPMVG